MALFMKTIAASVIASLLFSVAHADTRELQYLARDVAVDIRQNARFLPNYELRALENELGRTERILQYALRYPVRPSFEANRTIRNIIGMLDRARPFELSLRDEDEVRGGLYAAQDIVQRDSYPQPRPQPIGNPCQGVINGTWGYKGGRAMTITMTQQAGEQITVTVSQRNGAASAAGTCQVSFDGTASIQFSAPDGNNGNLSINRAGQVTGAVSGFSFVGATQ